MARGDLRSRSPWRPARIALPSMALALTVIAAGCGGSSGAGVAHIGSAQSESGSAKYSPPTEADKVAASRCMRSHGVPNFPDPINRRFGFYVKSGIDPESPQFKAAYSYCGNRYLGFSHRSSPAERAQWNAQTAKYAYCMRSHGLGNFPDPDGSGVINLPTANFLETAVAQRAQQACKSLDVHAGFVLTLPIR
jgi:hypothetical protein